MTVGKITRNTFPFSHNFSCERGKVKVKDFNFQTGWKVYDCNLMKFLLGVGEVYCAMLERWIQIWASSHFSTYIVCNVINVIFRSTLEVVSRYRYLHDTCL